MAAVKILIAVHGHEPAGWVREMPRLVAAHGLAMLRVLMVLDVAPVAFTSLLPAARRRFDAALAETRRLDELRVSATVGELIQALPFPPEVRRVRVWRADAGRGIVAHAALWPADVVIVGRDGRSRLQRAALTPVHERVVRLATCAVVVAPTPTPVASRPRVRAARAATPAEDHA
jgi:nucleotide-binding universal stress UspA family protein